MSVVRSGQPRRSPLLTECRQPPGPLPACGSSVRRARNLRELRRRAEGPGRGRARRHRLPPRRRTSSRRSWPPQRPPGRAQAGDRPLRRRAGLNGSRRARSIRSLPPRHGALRDAPRDGVHRFEGTVTHYTGDGVMALFGAPIALEDLAQRPATPPPPERRPATLRQRAPADAQSQLAVRMGQLRRGGRSDDRRRPAHGLQPRKATRRARARMEQLAEPGKIYLTEHTAKLITGPPPAGGSGSLAVKGCRRGGGLLLVGVGPLRTA